MLRRMRRPHAGCQWRKSRRCAAESWGEVLEAHEVVEEVVAVISEPGMPPGSGGVLYGEGAGDDW
eukprot:1332844-Heterocapsa_arctica.AAC.1